jgi:vancomycin resistance protein YoaR
MRRALIVAGLATVGLAVAGGGLAVAASSGPAHAAAGTTVGTVDVSGLERAALIAAVKKAVAAGPTSVDVRLGTVDTQVATADLGLSIDVDKTVDRVLSTSSSRRRWGLLPAAKGRVVEPVVAEDDAQFAATVSALNTAGTVRTTEGALRFAGGTLTAVPPKAGQTVADEDLQAAVRAAAQRLPLPATISVPVTAVQPTTDVAAVDAAAEQGRTLLAQPPLLSAGSKAVQVQAADLGPMLILTPTTTLGLASDVSELSTKLASALSTAAREPKVSAPVPTKLLETKGNARWEPTPATVTLEAEGKAGQTVTAEDVLAALQEAVAAPGKTPTQFVAASAARPRSSAVGVAAIDSVLGTFTTHFPCCPPRVRNIQLMAKTLDGTLVGPGETFSINQTVGARTRAKGYVEAPFILDGELSTDIGGGVSQVGTTMLNAAFFAGVRLVEHKAHSFYIDRYPAGREATLNYPTLDVRWTNNTRYPILIRTRATSTSITVTLYGHDDGRWVESISGPRTPVAGRDFRVRITRRIHLQSGTVLEDGFTTTYNKPPEDH